MGIVIDTSALVDLQRRAPTYARLFAELRKTGGLIPANDLAVASTALYYGHELLVGGNDEAHSAVCRA